MKEKPLLYDLRCAVQPDKLCPAKVAIVGEASGDVTGRTSIENEATEILVQLKLREQNGVARTANLIGTHGDITETCPVRPMMNDNGIRRSILDAVRGGFHRASGRQTQ